MDWSGNASTSLVNVILPDDIKLGIICKACSEDIPNPPGYPTQCDTCQQQTNIKAAKIRIKAKSNQGKRGLKKNEGHRT